jgi:uncharacterized membrane protein YphA (DoxX/SURF4 family)
MSGVMHALTEYLDELWRSASSSWNRFWFTPTTPQTLCLLRLLAGAMLVYTHGVWSIDLVGFFGPDGRLPLEFARAMHNTPLAWSFLHQLQSPLALWTAHGLSLIVLMLFTLGLWTRWTSIGAVVITISYAHRSVGALFGLDQINSFLVLYLAMGPSGQCYSLDGWLWGRRGRAGELIPSIPANIAIRLIQLHMCVVYLFAGLGKLLGPSWWAGTALWGAFANLEYQTLDMTWVASYPIAVNIVTHVILAWEISYVALIWPKLTRPLMLALAIPLHLGIGICMGMITFGLIMLVGNMAFLSPVLVEQVIGARNHRESHRANDAVVAR